MPLKKSPLRDVTVVGSLALLISVLLVVDSAINHDLIGAVMFTVYALIAGLIMIRCHRAKK